MTVKYGKKRNFPQAVSNLVVAFFRFSMKIKRFPAERIQGKLK